jgi:hypothetical protein
VTTYLVCSHHVPFAAGSIAELAIIVNALRELHRPITRLSAVDGGISRPLTRAELATLLAAVARLRADAGRD